MSGPTLHVAFQASAAGHLKHRRRLLGANDQVICLEDDLSFGPIADGTSFDARARWFADELGYDWYDEIAARVEAFWEAVVSSSGTVIAWFGRGCPAEYCGFLEVLTRRSAPLKVVDVSNIAEAVGRISAEQNIELRLVDRATSLSPDEVAEHRSLWARLRAENAPLRLVGSPGLVSAPIDHFDGALIAATREDWERVIDVLDRCRRTNPLFLLARLRRLVDAGRVEARGEVSMATELTTRIRLPRGSLYPRG